MDLEDDAGKNLMRWDALPAHYWAVVGQAKQSAAATLAHALAARSTPRTPPRRSRDNALIVQQSYGLGRVLYVGLDSTWRWRKGVGDAYHHRFWGQVARWAADRPLQTNNRYLRFGASEPVYRSGQDVELSVRFNELKDAAKAAPGQQAEGAPPRRQRAAAGGRGAESQEGPGGRPGGQGAEPAGRRLRCPPKDGRGYPR